jgi:polysaccharide chain length determinant protein (PEP-CTERM system associated)
MLGHRELTMEDYSGILKRRYWLIVLCSLSMLAVGFGLTFVLPAQYLSQTLVIVQQQKVPENYVKPVVTEDLNERLASMSGEILSRSRLEPIVTRYDLFANQGSSIEDRVELTRKAIGIKPVEEIGALSAGNKHVPGFYISFKGRSAHVAQQVCAEITSLFVSESISSREQSAEGTTSFLTQQVAEAKRALDEQDAKLAVFQQKNLGRLPEQEQSNLSALQSLTTQLDASTQELNRLQQEQTVLTAMIAEMTSNDQRTDPVAGDSLDALQKQLIALTAEKQELDTLYTPDHPDVLAAGRKIEELKKQITEASNKPSPKESAGNAPRKESTQLLQSKAQLRSIEQSVLAQKQEEARIQQAIRSYQARIETSPAINAEFKQVTRDHETALQFYNTLLSKMSDSSMATDLERRQQGEQFQVLDAANLPDEPTFPNPLLFVGGGLGFGVVLGLLLTVLLEYRDTTLRNERDIFAFTNLPTLALISYIDELPQPIKRSRLKGLFSRVDKPIEGTLG